jgi:hypothetical protein
MKKMAITMRELQRISARKIQELEHPTAIKSGNDTIALLVPLRKAPKSMVDKVLADIDAAAAARSPEENARIAAMLGEEPEDE